MRTEIEKALVFISQNFRNKLNTPQLSEVAGISSFHFHRLFILETGLTPQKYVEKLRLEHAAHMMALNPEITKIQLAFESGFSSPSVFSRAFNSYFGVSPSKYQKGKPNPTVDAEKLEKSQAFSLTNDLHIQHLSGLNISAQLLSPESYKIDQVISEHFAPLAPITLYGVYLDAPIHLAPADCRYLLGLTEFEGYNYQIESGYYVSLKARGSFDRLKDRIIELHKYLTQQNYRIREPIAVEKIVIQNDGLLFNYQEIERDLFIPVSRI